MEHLTRKPNRTPLEPRILLTFYYFPINTGKIFPHTTKTNYRSIPPSWGHLRKKQIQFTECTKAGRELCVGVFSNQSFAVHSCFTSRFHVFFYSTETQLRITIEGETDNEVTWQKYDNIHLWTERIFLNKAYGGPRWSSDCPGGARVQIPWWQHQKAVKHTHTHTWNIRDESPAANRHLSDNPNLTRVWMNTSGLSVSKVKYSQRRGGWAGTGSTWLPLHSLCPWLRLWKRRIRQRQHRLSETEVILAEGRASLCPDERENERRQMPQTHSPLKLSRPGWSWSGPGGGLKSSGITPTKPE